MNRCLVFGFMFFLVFGSVAITASTSLYVPKTQGKGVLGVFPDLSSYNEFKSKMTQVYDIYKKEQAVGLLAVSSAPDGAFVYLDGVYRGTTTLGAKAAPGAYLVRLRKPGFADYDTSALVLPGTEKTIHVDLRDLNPAGASFSLPVGELSSAVHPLGGFQANTLLRDKKGKLYLVYSVEYASAFPYEYKYTRIGADGDREETVNHYKGLLSSLAIAVSGDNGKTWSFVQRFEQPDYGGGESTETITELYLEGVNNEGIAWRVITKRVEKFDSVAKASFLVYQGVMPLEDGIRVLYKTSTFDTRTERTTTRTYTYAIDAKGNPKLQASDYSNELPDPVVTGPSKDAAYSTDTRSETTVSVPEPVGISRFAKNSSISRMGAVSGRYWFRQYGKTTPRLLSSVDLRSFSVDYDLQHSLVGLRVNRQATPYFLDLDNNLYARAGSTFNLLGTLGGGSKPSMEFDGQGNLHVSFSKIVSSTAELYYQYFPVQSHPRQAVFLFTQSNCPACTTVKSYLSGNNIVFEENPTTLDASLNRSVTRHLKDAGAPVLVIKRSDSDYRFVTRTDEVGLDQVFGISKARRVAVYPKGLGSAWTQLFLDPKENPSIVAETGTGFRLYSFDSGQWTEKLLYAPPYADGTYLRTPMGLSNSLDLPYNKYANADDISLLVPVSSQKVDIGGSTDPYLRSYRIGYSFFTTRVKEDRFGEFSFDQVLAAPSVPATAVVAKGKPFVYVGTVASKATIIEFSADQETHVVKRQTDCLNRPNCLVFDTSTGVLGARLKRGAQVRVDDSYNGAITRVDVEPISDSGQLLLVQGDVLKEGLGKIYLRFSKDGVTYRGDATSLMADVDLSGTDYPQEKQRFGNLLTKKAYLIMKNKQMIYGVGQKKPPFVTEFELLYLLKEAENVAETVYGADYASAVQVSKSQWLKAYADKDTSDVGLNPFSSLINGGSTSTGVPVLRLPLVDPYVPGWYEDRQGDLINFAHVYAVAGFGDLDESDVRNAWRTMGYSYLGDRGFSFAYLGSYLACLFVCPSMSETALENALGEAPLDELIADFYALDLRTSWRHSSARLSDVLKSYFGSEQQQRAKILALTEAQEFGYVLGS